VKTLAVISLLGALFGLSQPTLAQAVHVEPMSGMQQLGVCGGCISLLAIVLLRTLPGMGKLHADAIKEAAKTNADAMKEAAEINAKGTDRLATEISAMRSESRQAQDSQIGFLRELVDK
jgi:hypothetical protein